MPEADRLSAAQLLDLADEVFGKLWHQPKFTVTESLSDLVGYLATDAGRANGAVRNGVIHLFRDAIGSPFEARKTIWHELLHYGIRRFLTPEQYIREMRALAMRDPALRAAASVWKDTKDADKARKWAESQPNLKDDVDGYVFARGVDEQLATLAEAIGQNGSTYARNDAYHRTLHNVRAWLAALADKLGLTDVAQWIRGMDNLEPVHQAHPGYAED